MSEPKCENRGKALDEAIAFVERMWHLMDEDERRHAKEATDE